MRASSDRKNIIAILGRPNVGKSSLFNRLIGRRVSIVHEQSGITRDRVEYKIELKGSTAYLVDTGGIDFSNSDGMVSRIREQSQQAIKEAHLLLMMVDAQSGMTSLDEEIARIVRESGKPHALVVNKVDTVQQEMLVQEFYRLGFKKVISISSLHGRGLVELMDELEEHVVPYQEAPEECIRVAVIGRPNAGKSTLINRLVGVSRLIVDARPGTTRDSIDVELSMFGRSLVLVDTAGMRRRKLVRTGPETFSVSRSVKTMRRADIIILVIDVSEAVTAQDVRLMGEMHSSLKNCVIYLNKWDLIKKVNEEDFTRKLIERWSFIRVYPVIYGSGLTGLNLDPLMKKVIQVYDESFMELTHEVLHEFLLSALDKIQPPTQGGRSSRFYTMIQTGKFPPKFNIHVSHPEFIKESYRLFIENEFRRKYGFQGVPLVFKYVKGRLKKSESSIQEVALHENERDD